MANTRRMREGHSDRWPTWHLLAAGHVFYEFGDGQRGPWDTFSARNIGLSVQRRMAAKFGGDPEKMRRATSAALEKILQVDTETRNPIERAAFEDFACVLSLVPELKSWTSNQQQALTQIILAKATADETDYLRLLQRHDVLKVALVTLGSSLRVAETRKLTAKPAAAFCTSFPG